MKIKYILIFGVFVTVILWFLQKPDNLVGKSVEQQYPNAPIESYSTTWQPADAPFLLPIARIITSNNITGCGELYLRRLSESTFAIACSANENVWKFYEVNLDTQSIIRLNNDAYETPY